MDLPKFNETFVPILEILKDEKIIKGRDLIKKVIDCILINFLYSKTFSCALYSLSTFFCEKKVAKKSPTKF